MTDSTTPRGNDSYARDLLAPIYGEAPTLGTDESAAFEATRDLIGDWMRPHQGDERLSSGLRGAVLDRVADASAAAAQVSAIAGTVWIRRAGAREAFVLGDDRAVRRGDVVITPRGARAMLLLADGSTVMVREESELAVGASSGIAERLSLLTGRFYAWIEKQREAVFTIRTPYGFAAVVGTEFDLQSDREGNLALVVTEGQVNFRPASANASEVALRRNEMLEHRATTFGTRRLTNSEAMRMTEWARGKRRGQVNGIVVGVIAVVVVAAVAVFFFMNKESKPVVVMPMTDGKPLAASAAAAPATTTSATAPAKAPADSFNLFLLQPSGERSRTTSVMKGPMQGAGEVETRMVMLTESKPDSPLVRIVLEEGDMTTADGKSVEGPQNAYASMRGLAFTMTYNPKTHEFSDPKSEREDKTGGDPFALLMFMVNMNAVPTDHAALRPGEDFDLKRGGDFPLIPGAKWNVDMNYRFDGFDVIDGKRVANISGSGSITVENAAIVVQTTPTYTRTILAKKMVIKSTSHSIYEVANSRLIESRSDNTTKMDLEMQMSVQGGEPKVMKIPVPDSTQSGTITTEYLP